MRRRALLAAVASGTAWLAGCGGRDRQSETVTPAPVPTMEPPSPSVDAGASRAGEEPDALVDDGAASVVEFDITPVTCALWPRRFTAAGANVGLGFARPATDEHPARVVGYLENGTDVDETFRLADVPGVGQLLAHRVRGDDHAARLHLAPSTGNEIAETVPAVAKDEGGFWYVEGTGPWVPETVDLGPGQWVSLEYALVGERRTSGWPPGTYEFSGPDGTVRVAVWNTDSPGPEEPSRFAGRTVPVLSDGRTVQWYHDADASTAAFVRPSVERTGLDAAIDVELVNHSHASLGCGHWNLHKLVDGEWFHVGPLFHSPDCRMVPPGDRIRWTLRAFSGEPTPRSGDERDGRVLTRGYLGGGVYAVVADYGHPVDASGALVELVSPPVELVPTDDSAVDRRGDTVLVTTGRHDDEHPPDDSFALSRTDAAGERVIAEQVMASGSVSSLGPGVRNGLAVFDDDVERVIVRTDEHAVDAAVGYGASTRRFSFRGQAYVASRDVESE